MIINIPVVVEEEDYIITQFGEPYEGYDKTYTKEELEKTNLPNDCQFTKIADLSKHHIEEYASYVIAIQTLS